MTIIGIGVVGLAAFLLMRHFRNSPVPEEKKENTDDQDVMLALKSKRETHHSDNRE